MRSEDGAHREQALDVICNEVIVRIKAPCRSIAHEIASGNQRKQLEESVVPPGPLLCLKGIGAGDRILSNGHSGKNQTIQTIKSGHSLYSPRNLAASALTGGKP